MKKINTQSLSSINNFDFTVTYISSGEAVIHVGFYNDNILVHKSDIYLTKENTDNWQDDDTLIIEKIKSKFPTIDFTILND